MALYLSLFKIAANITEPIFQMFDYKFIFILSFMTGVHFLQSSMIAQNENFVN